MRRSWALPIVMVCVAVPTGCARRMGERATRGAIEEVRRQRESDPDARPIGTATESVVRSTLMTLEEPEQRQKLDALVALVSAAAVDAATKALGEQRAEVRAFAGDMTHEVVAAMRSELAVGLRDGWQQAGPPVAQLLHAAVQEASAAAVAGTLAQILPGCDPALSPGCVEARIVALSRAVGRSSAEGVADALGIWPLVLAFMLGAIAALLGALLVTALRGARSGAAPRLEPRRT